MVFLIYNIRASSDMQVDDVKCVKQYNGGIHGSEQQVLHGFTVLRDLDGVNLRGGHLTLVRCKQEQWNGTLYVMNTYSQGRRLC